MDERTEIASRIMAGILANPNQNTEVWDPGLADVSVGYADALLAHLRGEFPAPKPPQAARAIPPVPAPAQAASRPSAKASTTLRDLGVSGRACAPLERMGVETLAQLAVQSRKDISTVRGVSVETLKQFDDLLAQHGLTWDWNVEDQATTEAEVEEDESEVEDEATEDEEDDLL